MYLEMLALRVIASAVLAVLLLQSLRHQNNFSTEIPAEDKIRWIAIIVLSIFICSGLRMADSDPIQFDPNHVTPGEIQVVAKQVFENKQNLLRFSDFYTFIPFGFCLGIIVYGISQIIPRNSKENN